MPKPQPDTLKNEEIKPQPPVRPTEIEKIAGYLDEALQSLGCPVTVKYLLSQAQAAERERIREFVLDEVDIYIEAKDNDSHRYQIPDSKQQEWDEFLDIPEDDERSWDVPNWAERIDGKPIKQHGLNKLLEALQKEG